MGSASIHPRRLASIPGYLSGGKYQMLAIGRPLNGGHEDDPDGRAVDGIVAGRALADGKGRRQAGNNHPTSIPIRVHDTDGYINIATKGERIRERHAQVIVRSLIPTMRPHRRVSKTATRSTAKLTSAPKGNGPSSVNELHAAGVPSGPIYSIDQIFVDARCGSSAKGRRSLQDLGSALMRYNNRCGSSTDLVFDRVTRRAALMGATARCRFGKLGDLIAYFSALPPAERAWPSRHHIRACRFRRQSLRFAT